MTTKQEIIDYIKEDFEIVEYNAFTSHYYIKNEVECNKLIQMIKGLKPQVKKLKWDFCDCKNNIYYTGWDAFGDVFCKIRFNKGFNGLYIIDETDTAMTTLDKAQEICQKHYEGTILGALEE